MASFKIILVTGSSSGIGLCVSRFLIENGYKLVLVDRNNEKLEELKADYKQAVLKTYSVDLCQFEQINALFDDLNANQIKLDGLVHCAGVEGSLSPVRLIKHDYLDLLMKLHYEAFVEMGRLFYKKNASNDGASMIAMSSLASIMCTPNSIDYSASKAALNAAIKVMSKEFLKRNIRVNGIMPANVNTPMCKNLDSFTDIKAIQALGFIEPIDIAYLIEFLLSDKSKYITGALIPVSAGMNY